MLLDRGKRTAAASALRSLLHRTSPARHQAFVILDDTLPPIDRVGMASGRATGQKIRTSAGQLLSSSPPWEVRSSPVDGCHR
jgi:hypothetical protein